MFIKISKLKWLEIGHSAGWLEKIAMDVVIDPKLLEAAKLVVEQGRLIREVAEQYRVNIDKLSVVVIDLRKEKSMPVDEILQLFDNGYKTKSLYNKLNSLGHNISYEDLIWLLRRKRPKSPISLKDFEVEKAIKLREEGKSFEEIENIIRVNASIIRRKIKEIRPDLVNSPIDSLIVDQIFDEYKNMISEGGSHNDVVKELSKRYSYGEGALRRVLRERGVIVGEAPILLTQEEKDKILSMANMGHSISEISNAVNRDRKTIRNFLLNIDPDLYKKITNNTHFDLSTLSGEVKRNIYLLFEQGNSYKQIKSELMNNGIDIPMNTLMRLKKTWKELYPQKASQRPSYISKGLFVEEPISQEQPTTGVVHPTEVKVLTDKGVLVPKKPEKEKEEEPQDYNGLGTFLKSLTKPMDINSPQYQRFLERQRMREVIDKSLKKEEEPITSSRMNWYKLSQVNKKR